MLCCAGLDWQVAETASSAKCCLRGSYTASAWTGADMRGVQAGVSAAPVRDLAPTTPPRPPSNPHTPHHQTWQHKRKDSHTPTQAHTQAQSLKYCVAHSVQIPLPLPMALPCRRPSAALEHVCNSTAWIRPLPYRPDVRVTHTQSTSCPGWGGTHLALAPHSFVNWLACQRAVPNHCPGIAFMCNR